MKHVDRLTVSMAGAPVGTLAADVRGKIYFEYAPSWINGGFALSPMKHFRLRPGAYAAENVEFDGLHGVFNDALPDGWGLLLMDRALKAKAGWSAHEILPLDRLSYIGDRAMGALEFKPVMEKDDSTEELTISALAEAALLVNEGDTGDMMRALQLHGGSPGGARPKVTVALSADGDRCISGFHEIPEGYQHWIVKFRARNGDPDCMGRIEMAYAQMARDAGIEMPETRLIAAEVNDRTEHYFAVRRFDRDGMRKKHVLTLGGMLEASHRVPCLDYDQLLQAVGFATRDVREVAKAFRLMVFNVLAHNKDDHVRNFAFIRDGDDWRLTPAFDLTFSAGMSNQHMTAIAGKGNPSLVDIRTIAERHSIKNWKEVVEQVRGVVAAWLQYAEQWKVDEGVANDYERALLGLPSRAAP